MYAKKINNLNTLNTSEISIIPENELKINDEYFQLFQDELDGIFGKEKKKIKTKKNKQKNILECKKTIERLNEPLNNSLNDSLIEPINTESIDLDMNDLELIDIFVKYIKLNK